MKDNNAATRYLYAFQWLRAPAYREKDYDFKKVLAGELEVTDLSYEAKRLLRSNDTIRAIDSLILGSEQKYCHFCPDVQFYDSDYFPSNVEINLLKNVSLAFISPFA